MSSDILNRLVAFIGDRYRVDRELVDGVVTGAFELDDDSPEATAEHTPPAPDLALGAQ